MTSAKCQLSSDPGACPGSRIGGEQGFPGVGPSVIVETTKRDAIGRRPSPAGTESRRSPTCRR